ncbi:MAG TPA: trigger factor [Candidatus Saccharimonadales bacterium]
MQVTKETTSPTNVKLTVVADAAQLDAVKQAVLKRLSKNLKLQGFRPGKAPMNLVERSLDQNVLQTEFLEQAVNELYVDAIDQERVRPVAQPQVNIVKFVPYDTLEITAEVEAVGDITLPDYKKVLVAKKESKVTDKQVDEVIKDLQARAATREEVKRAAKKGDEVVIDFKGVDAKTKDAIAGADGKDYPLTLGSDTFIPGFEDNVIGMKPGDEKDFEITFPEDYGVKALQKKKVIFTVTAQKVQQLVEPAVDDKFAATVGPFKTADELRKDIRRELEAQAAQETERAYENDLMEALAKKTKVEIPKVLVDEEIERIEQQERQNVLYRGQTWQEHLDEEGVTEEEHREKNREGAELRVKSGLILGEIAEKEQIKVTPEELEIRMQLLKGRYAQDEQMQSELDKPENRRDILNRMMTEKTLDKLKSYQG